LPNSFPRAFFDARSFFKIKDKSALTFAFTTKEVLKNKKKPWAKMELPNVPGMLEEVSATEEISPNIWLHWKFKDET